MKPLTILILITTGVTGGAQNIVLTIAERLIKKGHHVTIATGVSATSNTLLLRAHAYGITTYEFKYLKRTYKPWNIILFCIEAFQYFKKNRFDCIHLHSSHALFAAPAARLAHHTPKIIFTFHGLSYLDPAHPRKQTTRFLINLTYRILLPFVDDCVFVSHKNRTDAVQYGLVRNGVVIYNGINASFLSRTEARKALGLPIERLIIGSIGRLDYPKNYEFLIRCLISLPTASLAIIGGGPERKRLEFLIHTADLSKRCILLGERNDAGRLVRAFDLFALPSRYEGLSLALIEAVMAGVPVLASDVGGNREVVNGSEEQLFTLHNANQFINKSAQIIGNPVLVERLSNNNSEYGARFNAEKMVDEYENIYSNPKS